jgi:glycolate oxidase iron-sulfur subunit
MAWITGDGPTRIELDTCVSCGLCLPHCPTFRLTGDETASPRGRLAAMNAIDEGAFAIDDVFESMMSFCLQCRACEAVCPSLVPFGRTMEGTRIEIATQRPSRSRTWRHRLLDRALPNRLLLRLATSLVAIAQRLRIDRTRLGRRLAGLRRLPIVPTTIVGRPDSDAKTVRGVAAVLAGCVMDPWFAGVHEATIELLERGGYDVVVSDGQTCCGALAAHDGAASSARRLAEANVSAFAEADVIVVDAAGCGAHMKEYGRWADGGEDIAARVRDVTEVVAELIADGSLPTMTIDLGEVAVQDPCHLRHAQRITQQPRDILRAAGHTVREIDPKGLCCGGAGLYTLLEPEAAGELGQQKADQVRSTGVTTVASANPGCEIQLRTHLGDTYDIRHPIEIYRDALQDRV